MDAIGEVNTINTKIKLHYLLGDVHMGGHDVHRIAKAALALLSEVGCFDVTLICDDRFLGDVSFDEYLSGDFLYDSQVIIFNCGNWRFNIQEEQEKLENAVSKGAGFLLMHGDHPCYWPAAKMAKWDGFEKLAGYVWREKTSHGDYGVCTISITDDVHPVTQGLEDFYTRDEIFCNMENPWHIPMTTLATAYSDPLVLSRHNEKGTGQNEPIVSCGNFGKGRTFNFALGHVWPYYTGHGLGENTMESWSPAQVRKIFVRACEWLATGDCVNTKNFTGKSRLS